MQKDHGTSEATHTLKAFTYTNELVPTLYVEGEIPTDGKKPIVELKKKEPQGTVPQNLLLEFGIDVYDPTGSSKLPIENFKEPMKKGKEYTSVTITADKGTIQLPVEELTKS